MGHLTSCSLLFIMMFQSMLKKVLRVPEESNIFDFIKYHHQFFCLFFTNIRKHSEKGDRFFYYHKLEKTQIVVVGLILMLVTNVYLLLNCEERQRNRMYLIEEGVDPLVEGRNSSSIIMMGRENSNNMGLDREALKVECDYVRSGFGKLPLLFNLWLAQGIYAV